MESIKTREQMKNENLEKIPLFKLMDDTYMTAFFNEKPELIQLVLRIIMGNDKLTVTKSKVQKQLKNLQGRSITLDIDAIGDNGKEFDIEIQQEIKGARPKRARYHSSVIDSNALIPGDDFEKLPETYVIFITADDYWKKGLPIYTINRYVEELGMAPFGDEAHIIYVNGENDDDTPLGKLMHDFKCTKPQDMYYKDLADRANHLKNTEGGRAEMCKIMEEIADERERQGKYQIAMRLIKMGCLSVEQIAEATDLSVEDVDALVAYLKVNA